MKIVTCDIEDIELPTEWTRCGAPRERLTSSPPVELDSRKREFRERLLSAKFGELPERIAARAETMSEAELDSVLDGILTSANLDELGLDD